MNENTGRVEDTGKRSKTGKLRDSGREKRGTRGLEGDRSNPVPCPFSSPLLFIFSPLLFSVFIFPVFTSPLSRCHSSSCIIFPLFCPFLGHSLPVFTFPLVLSFSHFHPFLPILLPNTRGCAHARGALAFPFLELEMCFA